MSKAGLTVRKYIKHLLIAYLAERGLEIVPEKEVRDRRHASAHQLYMAMKGAMPHIERNLTFDERTSNAFDPGSKWAWYHACGFAMRMYERGF